jgi:hypothetical protein
MIIALEGKTPRHRRNEASPSTEARGFPLATPAPLRPRLGFRYGVSTLHQNSARQRLLAEISERLFLSCEVTALVVNLGRKLHKGS